MTPAEAAASASADVRALEHVAGLVLQLNARMSWLTDFSVMTPAEVDARVQLVHDVWAQLDELGVDLHLPDLKALVAAHVATHQAPSGAVEAQETPAGGEARVGTATPLPAPLGPDQPDYFQGEAGDARDH